MSKYYFLYESPLGYGLFEIDGYEEISQNSTEFQTSIGDWKKVSKIIKKINFLQFRTSEEAWSNAKAVNDTIVTNELKEFLSENFPKKKKKETRLGCVDKTFAQKISEEVGVKIIVGDFLVEISRAIRVHFAKFVGESDEVITKSELGLGHSYSRMMCMFDVNRQDKPVIQSIALIDLLDKDINSFCMRIKEWFGWHFPELARIISDNYVYVRIVKLIENKDKLLAEKDHLQEDMKAIILDDELTQAVIDAAAISMGSDISEGDLLNIKYFSQKVESLIKYRENLSNYLRDKMKKLAPNTSALVGEIVAARLISHAGSLSALAKYPASTIQILGAEKALFRALKTKTKTPKYGLWYHSSFIGKAKTKNKGKISRYLANKLAMCARIDYFSDDRFDSYGNELKTQIEDRLIYLDGGAKPRKNVDVMKTIAKKLAKKKMSIDEDKEEKVLNKKRKKDVSESSESESESVDVVQNSSAKKKVVVEDLKVEKKEKSKKKKPIKEESSESE